MCVIYLLYKQKQSGDIIISFILALFWFWSGVVYLGSYYVDINWAGEYGSWIFLVQSLLIFWFGVYKRRLHFEKNIWSIGFTSFIGLIYPMLLIASKVEVFNIHIVGMLPISTLAFTLAIFLSLANKIKSLLIIPLFISLFTLYWSYLLWDFFSLEFSILSLVFLVFIFMAKGRQRIN